MKRTRKLFLLLFIFVLILVLIGVFSFKTYNKYTNWNSHKDYFKQDKSKIKVEDWMSIRLIESKFNIDFENKSGVELNFYEKKDSIETICIEKKLDCEEIIKNINSQSTKDKK